MRICSLARLRRRLSPMASISRKRFFILLTIAGVVGLIMIATAYFPSSDDATAVDKSLQYAVVVDAGSSGSRAYLYSWPPHSGRKSELLKIQPLRDSKGEPLVKKSSPGLSSYADKSWQAASHIAPLLDFASQHIPKEKHHETQLYILATAGMRLLDKDQQDAILSNLRVFIPSNYSFFFPPSNVEIISGRQEGLYQWVAINFALGRFENVHERNSAEHSTHNHATVGALDMGGASLQVAFEVPDDFKMETGSLAATNSDDMPRIVDISLGCTEHDVGHSYKVYVATFLGYGANEALQRHELDLVRSSSMGNKSVSPIADPCLPWQMKDDVLLDASKSWFDKEADTSEKVTAAFNFSGTGNWGKCYQSLEPWVSGESKLALGIPPLPFKKVEFYGFSEFWYSLEDVLRIGGVYDFHKLESMSKEFCSTRWASLLSLYRKNKYPLADWHRFRYQCFKSAWVSVALHEGLGFPKHSNIVDQIPNGASLFAHGTKAILTSAPNSVGQSVVHWTLGALLYRTRFLPLRAVEQATSSRLAYYQGQYHTAWSSGYLYSNYVVLLCLFAVFTAIMLYLRRLRRYWYKTVPPVPDVECGRRDAVVMKLNPFVFQ